MRTRGESRGNGQNIPCKHVLVSSRQESGEFLLKVRALLFFMLLLAFTRTRKTGRDIQKQKVTSRGNNLGSAVCD